MDSVELSLPPPQLSYVAKRWKEDTEYRDYHNRLSRDFYRAHAAEHAEAMRKYREKKRLDPEYRARQAARARAYRAKKRVSYQ